MTRFIPVCRLLNHSTCDHWQNQKQKRKKTTLTTSSCNDYYCYSRFSTFNWNETSHVSFCFSFVQLILSKYIVIVIRLDHCKFFMWTIEWRENVWNNNISQSDIGCFTKTLNCITDGWLAGHYLNYMQMEKKTLINNIRIGIQVTEGYIWPLC